MNKAILADKVLSVAPMMAWTDTHCRVLHRMFSPNALLFTEMVSVDALVHGATDRLLRFHPSEQPVGCQVGGNDPAMLAHAAVLVARAGFTEINLNVGCPSDRVRSGGFGACLMASPGLVAEAVGRMHDAVEIPVTVKCRLGIDDLDSREFLHDFVGTVADAGCQRFYVHARKAILKGLSPAQNRSVPPLQPQRVYELKSHFSDLQIVLNGGIADVPTARDHLDRVDGVMIGRAAYRNPRFLAELDTMLFDQKRIQEIDVLNCYLTYVERQLDRGVRLQDMTRHLLGLFNGRSGARRYRHRLSDSARLKAGDAELIREAARCIRDEVA